MSHPVRRAGLLYPEWSEIADNWHGVHITVRGVASTHAVQLREGADIIAAPYWDVESTVWLRWVFEEATAEQVCEIK